MSAYKSPYGRRYAKLRLRTNLPSLGGYYTTLQIVTLLANMALCRIKTVEQLQHHSPGELVKLKGQRESTPRHPRWEDFPEDDKFELILRKRAQIPGRGFRRHGSCVQWYSKNEPPTNRSSPGTGSTLGPPLLQGNAGGRDIPCQVAPLQSLTRMAWT